ncbi:MAG: ribosome-binding factor A [Candidatus Babeliaceae bacterium]|jgi:ribosome-binding factor A
MAHSSVSDIKRAQKESALLRIISNLFMQTALDDNRIKDVFVNRVTLSPDKGSCFVFFYSPKGEEYFHEMLKILILYKPSLRKAVAQSLQARYTPELIFKFDHHFEKTLKIEQLIDKAKGEDQF